MSVEHVFYTISHRADGWHAGQHGLPSERVFVSKEEALKWCKQQAQQSSASAAPEEGAYSDVEVEIRE
jgi:hypothetical protein